MNICERPQISNKWLPYLSVLLAMSNTKQDSSFTKSNRNYDTDSRSEIHSNNNVSEYSLTHDGMPVQKRHVSSASYHYWAFISEGLKVTAFFFLSNLVFEDFGLLNTNLASERNPNIFSDYLQKK